MQIIQTVIDQNSPYPAAYTYMHAVEQSEQLCASAENRPVKEVRLHFKRGPDQRRCNLSKRLTTTTYLLDQMKIIMYNMNALI